VLDSYIVMIHEIECFLFVKIWLAYPLFLVVLCLIFYLWWSCLVCDIVNMFWKFILALLC